MTEAERWELGFDRAALIRACGDGGALELWRVLYAAWLRIPTAARRELRGRFDMRVVVGSGAHVGVPASSAAVGRPEIVIGAAVDDAGLSFAHELSHVALGHCDLTGADRGPARVYAWALAPEVTATALADGVGTLAADPWLAELAKEREAWQLVKSWGFDVPARLLGEV